MIFAITGCCLDRKKKLLFSPSYKENENIDEKNGHKRIANHSISISAPAGIISQQPIQPMTELKDISESANKDPEMQAKQDGVNDDSGVV